MEIHGPEQNPEVLAPFIDVFVIGDGEESLPWLMAKWMELKERACLNGLGPAGHAHILPESPKGAVK